jgi:coproporphyrinogen III oxidase
MKMYNIILDEKNVKKYQRCNGHEWGGTMLNTENKAPHPAQFEVTEKINRYKIKTHGCQRCYAAYKKIPDEIDYVWHRDSEDMEGYGDIWFFDLSSCPVEKCFKIIIY